jgi:hypothetical protein
MLIPMREPEALYGLVKAGVAWVVADTPEAVLSLWAFSENRPLGQRLTPSARFFRNPEKRR